MISFAQNFEDVVLSRIFRGQTSGTYVDVGAHYPIVDSVTEHFYRLGWRGVNIEPLPAAYAELSQARPYDININCAISDAEGEMTFFALDGFSTLEADVASAHQKTGLAPSPVSIRTRTLAEVLATYGVERIDFLKVDVEGAERAVLASNDWNRFRPALVLVEAIAPVTKEPTHSQWEDLLTNAGYAYVHFDGVNRFYWNSDRPLPEPSCFLPPNALDGFASFDEVSAVARAASAAREAAYERQRTTTLLTAIANALSSLEQGGSPPPPDAALASAWEALLTQIAAWKAPPPPPELPTPPEPVAPVPMQVEDHEAAELRALLIRSEARREKMAEMLVAHGLSISPEDEQD